VLETAIRSSKVDTQGTIFDEGSQFMTYVDDVITIRTLQKVPEVFTSSVKQTNKMGSEINKEKTTFTLVSQKTYNENVRVKLVTYNFATVEDCTYLGTVLPNKPEL
jgi:hypothetical protein